MLHLRTKTERNYGRHRRGNWAFLIPPARNRPPPISSAWVLSPLSFFVFCISEVFGALYSRRLQTPIYFFSQPQHIPVTHIINTSGASRLVNPITQRDLYTERKITEVSGPYLYLSSPVGTTLVNKSFLPTNETPGCILQFATYFDHSLQRKQTTFNQCNAGRTYFH